MNIPILSTKKCTFILCVMFLLSGSFASAQNRISVSKRSPIYMDLKPGNSAGLAKEVIIDNSQWLNYSTLVHPSDPTMSITVEIASGSVPDGMELQIEAGSYTGISKSKQGNPSGKIYVSNRPRVLIDNIGTCYTGSGRNEGHQITFSFVITDYAKVKAGTHTVNVQYTITQQ